MIPPLVAVNRRALLKGACSSLLLPVLPSLAWADDPAAPMVPTPTRWVSMIFANGALPSAWWARGSGATMELSPSLMPLQAHRGAFTVLNGLHLFDVPIIGQGGHYPHFTNFLSGVHLDAHVMAESCDQLMARTIGSDSPMPALNLSIEPPPFGLSMGYPSLITATISWSSPSSPVTPIVSPRDAFDALFDAAGLERQRSVLDAVLGDIAEIHGHLSQEDGRRLDAYADAVRDLERRIERAIQPPAGAWHPLSAPKIDRPALGSEEVGRLRLDRHQMLMIDLMVLALRMGKTRIATLVLENDLGGNQMSFIDGVTESNLHGISHHGTDPSLTRQYQLTNAYHVSLLATLMSKMAAIDEGGASLLDNTMILFGSTLGDGHIHDGWHLPLILAGGGGGTLKPGGNLTPAALEDKRLCNLHLALLQRMGVRVDGKPIQRFGNSCRPLEGI